MSTLMEHLMKMLGVRHIKTSPYHLQTNSMLERFHATLKAMLQKSCPVAKRWDKYLPYLCFAYCDQYTQQLDSHPLNWYLEGTSEDPSRYSKNNG